jgi:pimeloyl-ACP methyl ester carboxylesterase
MPHGGPWLRDVWEWRGDVQFFASRGYAVFQPNYRGSAGYEWRFAPSDRWDFAKMSADVNRIAIMGFGFGGYLAIRGAEDEPDLYRCAMTLGGAFDWDEAFDSLYGKNNATFHELREHLKEVDPADGGYKRISPMWHTDKIKIPIFITNNLTEANSTDITTLDTQTDELSRAIPRRVPKVVFGDLNLQNQDDAFVDLVERFEKMDSFLKTYLAALPAAAGH